MTPMEELTDYQIQLLKICDHVRWGENSELDGFKYHLVRRACGQKDAIVEFELKAAIAALEAAGGAQRAIDHPDEFPSPPIGSVERSPWMSTYEITPERYEAAGVVSTPPVTGTGTYPQIRRISDS